MVRKAEEVPNGSEPDDVIELLLAHNASFSRKLLQQLGEPTSGTKAQLSERLLSTFDSEKLGRARALRYLDQIEGWGKQQVFLYKSPSRKLLSIWRDREKVQVVLRKNGNIGLLNKPRPVLLPENPVLSTVEWAPSRLRLVWTEKRTWEERAEDDDEYSEDGRILWKAYRVCKARGTTAFDWDLGSGEAMVMIQQLPSGSKYAEERDALCKRMASLIDIDEFAPVQLNQAIVKIGEGDEVRVRRSSRDTLAGGEVILRSAGKRRDVGDDPALAAAENAVRGQTVGSFGNFYWIKDDRDNLEKDIRITLHAKDHRIGIFGERTEAEIRYVIGRIRTYC